jgi:hypothetical protein
VLERGRLKPVFEKLKTSPDDPESSLRAGKFYCLITNDWSRGLDALAKSQKLELKTLAEMETAVLRDEKAGRTPDLAARKGVGDAWWDFAAKEREPYLTRARQRAGHHYGRAMKLARDQETKDRLWDRLASLRRPVDLLAMVDLKRDVVEGTGWAWRGRELSAQGEDCSLAFPYPPPKEFDFALEFTITSTGEFGNHRLMQFVPAGDKGSAKFQVTESSRFFDGWLPANVDKNRPPAQRVRPLAKGRHTTLVRYRKDSIRCSVDGQLAYEWHTDMSAVKPAQQILNKPALGIGSGHLSIVYHAAKLTEVPDELPAR